MGPWAHASHGAHAAYGTHGALGAHGAGGQEGGPMPVWGSCSFARIHFQESDLSVEQHPNLFATVKAPDLVCFPEVFKRTPSYDVFLRLNQRSTTNMTVGAVQSSHDFGDTLIGALHLEVNSLSIMGCPICHCSLKLVTLSLCPFAEPMCFVRIKTLSFSEPRHCPFSEPRHYPFPSLFYTHMIGEPSGCLWGNHGEPVSHNTGTRCFRKNRTPFRQAWLGNAFILHVD